MTDNTSTSGSTSGLIISDETRSAFPELITMILASESMNTEERQYWINILPIMTPEQIQNLKDILTNEKDQLAAIDKKYSKSLSADEEKERIENTDAEMQKRRLDRSKREESFEEKDDEASEDLLKKIEDL